MPGNRKAAEAQILADLEAISPGCADVEIYKTYFASMNDKEFEAFIDRLATKKEWIVLTVPNLGKNTLSIERNYALADKWKIDFHQRLLMPEENGLPAYMTPNDFLVVTLPIRVASQRLAKKMSIPKHQRVINTMTGQPTGDSKGASFSSPELRLAIGMGLEATATELMKYRGGDQRGYAAMNASLVRHGKATQDTLKNFASGVVSTATVKTYFTAAHLSNTL
jgi:hypothetical protein